MTLHFAENRQVITYQENGWPVGVLTGYGLTGGDTWHIEHVIVFPHAPRGTLLRMARAGIAEAWAQYYSKIIFGVPMNHPNAYPLTQLAWRLGFRPYTANEYAWWVLHK